MGDENKENEKEILIDEQSKDSIRDCDPINDSINKESDVSEHNDNSDEEESKESSVEEENEVSQEENTSSTIISEDNKIPCDDIDSENKTSASPQKSPNTISQKRSIGEVKDSATKKKT